MFALTRATLTDCRTLAHTAALAFEDDPYYRQRGTGLLPRVDDPAWYERALNWSVTLKVMLGREPIGGVMVVRNTRRDFEIGLMWLVPARQGIGLGREVLHHLETRSGPGSRWRADVPREHERALHFYSVCDYRYLGESDMALFLGKDLASVA